MTAVSVEEVFNLASAVIKKRHGLCGRRMNGNQ